jgi:16S rRNA (adenine1518-N6/adenine1519-N6)-dimethyltransferase
VRQPLGQHFLHDYKVVKAILAAGELKPTQTALEIGPGKGVLTEGLIRRARRLVAVELDSRLVEYLQKRFAAAPLFSPVRMDILKADLDSFFTPEERPVKLFGNLPYSITSPIFEKLMPWPGWEVGVFLIQREVAARIAAPPGSRVYGILSLAVQLYADVDTILQVPPGAFHPPPKVHSSVIRLRRKKVPAVPPEHQQDFFDLLHGAFAHRRKTLANSLSFFTGIARAPLEAWLLRHKISPLARAETVRLEQFAQMAVAWSIFRRETNLT